MENFRHCIFVIFIPITLIFCQIQYTNPTLCPLFFFNKLINFLESKNPFEQPPPRGWRFSFLLLWVEGKDVDVTVFATTVVALVITSKVALDSSKLLFKSQMEESGFKLSNPGGGCGYVHGFLTTLQHHMVIDDREGSWVERALCLESLLSLRLVESKNLAELSLDEMTKMVMALDNWMSLMCREWSWAFTNTSPDLALYWLSLPLSWPVMMHYPQGSPNSIVDLGAAVRDLHVGLIAVNLVWIL